PHSLHINFVFLFAITASIYEKDSPLTAIVHERTILLFILISLLLLLFSRLTRHLLHLQPLSRQLTPDLLITLLTSGLPHAFESHGVVDALHNLDHNLHR